MADNGESAALEAQFIKILARRVSATTAATIVQCARTRLKLTASSAQTSTTADLLREIERGTKLFVSPLVLAEIAIELRGSLKVPVVDSVVIAVANEGDVSRARVAARTMCMKLDAGTFGVQKVATVISELARNIASYTPGGEITMTPRTARSPTLVIRASDRGKGIPNLTDILDGNYKSKTGMGMGLRGVKKLSEKFAIDTGSSGTTIDVEIRL